MIVLLKARCFFSPFDGARIESDQPSCGTGNINTAQQLPRRTSTAANDRLRFQLKRGAQ
jgi:hypothetical protein